MAGVVAAHPFVIADSSLARSLFLVEVVAFLVLYLMCLATVSKKVGMVMGLAR